MTYALTIRNHRVLGTGTKVYSAWEPGDPMTTHSTITFVDGKCLGHVPSRALPTEVEQMPVGSSERVREVQLFQAKNKAEAVMAIFAAHPEIDEASPRVRIVDGRVEVES